MLSFLGTAILCTSHQGFSTLCIYMYITSRLQYTVYIHVHHIKASVHCVYTCTSHQGFMNSMLCYDTATSALTNCSQFIFIVTICKPTKSKSVTNSRALIAHYMYTCTCIHYMHTLHAYITCIHYMHTLHAYITCIHYMHTLHE